MVENQALNEQRNCSAVRPFSDAEIQYPPSLREPNAQEALCLLSLFDRRDNQYANYPVTKSLVEAYQNIAFDLHEHGQYAALARLADNMNLVGHENGYRSHLMGKAIINDGPTYAVSREDLERIVQGR